MREGEREGGKEGGRERGKEGGREGGCICINTKYQQIIHQLVNLDWFANTITPSHTTMPL